MTETTILDAILEVFSSVGDWFASAVQDMMPMFYTAEGGLTILGITAIASLGLSIIMLIVGIITNFIQFRS